MKVRALVSPSTKVRNIFDSSDSLQSLGMVKVKSLKKIENPIDKLNPEYRPLKMEDYDKVKE